jgi:hypothetical protein
MNNFKKGDKVRLLGEVMQTYEGWVEVMFGFGGWACVHPNECQPVEPLAIKSLTIGDAVRLVLPGHRHHGEEGIVTLVTSLSKRQYKFESNCGQHGRWCTIEQLERIDNTNPTLTGPEMNAKTKQCIIDYFADYINARSKKGYSDWWTRESHIVNSKHIVAVLEHFKNKGYETELAGDDVTISW